MALQGVRGSVDFANPQPATPGLGGYQHCRFLILLIAACHALARINAPSVRSFEISPWLNRVLGGGVWGKDKNYCASPTSPVFRHRLNGGIQKTFKINAKSLSA